MTVTDEIDRGTCNCCEAEPAVGVAAIPGIPMSISWGRECLRQGAMPFFAANATVAQCVNPEDPDWAQMAEWFRTMPTYVDGQYVRLDTLELKVVDCNHDPGADYVEDGSCPACFHGKLVEIKV